VTFQITLMWNKIQFENGAGGCWLHLSADTSGGPEWTSTHQCTNVDGWCTDRILFSIPVPSQVDLFCLPFLIPDQPLSQFFFFFWNFSHPLTYYPTFSPTNLLTYIFKLKIDSSPSTYSPINLKCATLIPTHLHALPLFYLPTL
jgi:hypothetical protein